MINKIKKVKVKDLFGIAIFVIVLFPSIFYKLILKIKKKQLWLICENENIARDNGIVFYEYIRKKHPEILCYYAIDFSSPDYGKIKSLGNIVKWGGFKHYFLYMSSSKNISSHKQGNPNHALFTILHLYLHLYNNRVFLQHGVLYQNFEMFHKKNCYFKIFICGAKPEYDFVDEKFGYDNGEVRYTGLARFDNLHNVVTKKKIILYMPTWRRYLSKKQELEKSVYLQKILSFINSSALEVFLEKNNYELHFCPHDGLRDGKELFESNNKRVKVIDISKANIQQMLMESSVLITDFSSIHTDFAYMKKPVVYYQYDIEDYSEKHVGKEYKDTYYNFKKDGFGLVVENENDLLDELKRIIETNDLIVDHKYMKRIDEFFQLNDKNNCERIHREIVRG